MHRADRLAGASDVRAVRADRLASASDVLAVRADRLAGASLCSGLAYSTQFGCFLGTLDGSVLVEEFQALVVVTS